MKNSYKMNNLTCAALFVFMGLGCSENTHKNAQKSSTKMADTLDDISNTIRTVQETANEVKKFSEDMAVTGERVKGIKGVEILGNSQWEYKVVPVSESDAELLQNNLNELGEEGWELSERLGNNKHSNLVFKRRRQ